MSYGGSPDGPPGIQAGSYSRKINRVFAHGEPGATDERTIHDA